METIQQTNQIGHLCVLTLAEVHILDGFNPRKFIDDKKFRELVCSAADNGIFQPIVVRPRHDDIGGYWIVAGERRFRASREAGLADIPVMVRELTYQAAKLIAVLENTHRDDMSVIEEAQAARDVLMGCNNDRREAIRLLGWSPTKFESRLLLLHADQAVQDALTERKIKIGHAELLSQLPGEYQVATLEKIIEHGYSVPELKSKLTSFSLDLSKACFSLGDCNNCHHNSTMQSSLFEDHIGAGKCANRECFAKKTADALVERKTALAEQYSVVYLDTERSKESYRILCQLGSSGVGNAQFEQGCRQCAHFGALLNTSPDKLGVVTEDCCFNIDCHEEKVLAYKASTQQIQQSAATPENSTGNSGSIKSAPTKPPATTNGKRDKPAKSGVSASAATVPVRVVEQIETFYRELAAKTVTKDKRSILCLNTFGLYRLVRVSFPNELWPESIKKHGLVPLDLDVFLGLLSGLSTEEIAAFNNRLVCHLLSDHEKSTPLATKSWAKGAGVAISHIDVNLCEHFLLDRHFLGSFTKTGVESVLREAINGNGASFVDYYESQTESPKLANLMKLKSGEILDAVFGCGYDFTGFVPGCVFKFMGEDNVTAA
jgi:ParB family chromosome partitioning protein